MEEILPGIYHWTTFHEGIGQPVHSYLLAGDAPAVLIDPRVPDEGLEWFSTLPPSHAFLTNRHHYRHSGRFREAFGLTVRCHRAGLHEFVQGEEVVPFDHGDELPGGLLALPVGVLCPEETALYWPAEGVIALGDAVIRDGKELGFVPDAYMGDDPAAVKAGLRDSLAQLLERDFDHLLFAHGEPWIGGARAGLRRFVKEVAG